jgi:hypothetical protein
MNTEVRNAGQGIYAGRGEYPGNASMFLEFINMDVHHNGVHPDCDPIHPNYVGDCHAIYSNGSDILIDGGTWHQNSGFDRSHAFHMYPSPNNVTIRNAKSYNNGFSGLTIIYGNIAQVYNNVIYNNPQGMIFKGSNVIASNNTLYNNGGAILNEHASNIFRNNIVVGGGIDQGGGSFSATCCPSDPLFANAPGGDFRLTANSPAINFGTAACPSTDLEGKVREAGACDAGAYEFTGEVPPPQPVGLVGEWRLDAGSGTTAVNTAPATLGTQDGTLNSAGWTTPGIIGAADLATNGARWVTITPSATMRAISDEFGLSGWWRGTGAGGSPGGCELFSDGDSRVARIEPNGQLKCFFYHGAGWLGVTGGAISLFDGNTHHWSCSLDSGGDGLRARIDNASVAQIATSQTVSFTRGPQAFIGRHGDGSTDYTCGTGTIGNVYVFDQYITDSGNTNLFQEYVPLPNVSGIHVQWRTDDPPATIQGSLDTPITWTIGNTLVQEWYISNNSGATVVAHYPQFCSRNGGAYTQVTNTSQATIGVQVATSANANMGDSVTPSQNFGLTPVDGRAVVDTVSESLTTLPHGGVTAWRYYMAFGGVAQANDTYRCKPRKPFTTPLDLDHYFDDIATSIPLITLQSPAAIGSGVRSGGVNQGGKRQ